MDQAPAQLLTFRVDGESFGLRTELIREVARMPRLARVPNAPAALLGLANVRGSVMPILSAARLLHRPAGAPDRIIVLDTGELVGLAVDDASQLLAAGAAGITEVDMAELVARSVPAKAERRSGGAGAAALPAQDTAAEVADAVLLVAFAVGNQEFALPLAAVDEVLRLPEDIAAMPDADAVVVGSAAVRGAVLPLLSLRALLGLPSAGETPRTRVLVARIGRHRVGLLVDQMRSILRVPEAMIDAVPQVLSRGQAEARIQAICRLGEGERLVSVLAADQLLRGDITARLLQGNSGELQETMPDASDPAGNAASEQFLLFRIGAEEFGLPIAAVEEVTQVPARLTPLPRAPAFVLGLMSLRGQVIPVIDQAHRFGTEPAETARRRVIVARIGDLQAGFMVDAVHEVVRVDAAALQPAPDLGHEDTRVFERVANLGGKHDIVLIVDPRELLDRAEQDLLRALGGDPSGKEEAAPAP